MLIYFSANNTYSGGTNVNAGLLVLGVGNSNSLGTGGVAMSGGTLDLAGNTITIASLSGAAGTVTNFSDGPVPAVLTVSQSIGTTFSGQIDNVASYPISLIKSGSGSLTLAGASNYTGSTTLSGGTLQLGTGSSGQDGSIVANGGVTNNAALVYNLFGTQTAGYAISGSGTVTKQGGGTLVLNGNNSYAGGTSIQNGLLQLGSANALGGSSAGALAANGGTLDLAGYGVSVPSFSGAASPGGVVTNSGGYATLTVNVGANSTFGGAIVGNNTGLTITGSGVNNSATTTGLVLNGVNTYSGTTTLNNGCRTPALR